ncbi:MAG: zinc-dependent alcohol dehydrogenase family protein [Pseudomonadota bacterium]
MKAVQFDRHGVPADVVHCVERPAPGAPDGDQVLVRVLACPINPADLLILEGRYPGPEQLPAGGGIEGIGEVLAAGPEVAGLAPGDRVMLLGRANWVEQLLCPASAAIKISGELDPRQAAMMKVNPATALLMLRDYVDLAPGDWVIQNAANSAVGRHVIRMARAAGVKTVNVVRRQALVEDLLGEGADLVVIDGDDLGVRVRAEIGEAPLPLALDAVGGIATQQLADCLSNGGTVVNYGFLSGEACRITPDQTIIHDIRLRGFWLAGFFRRGDMDRLTQVYREIADHLRDGTLAAPIEAVYPLEQVKEAVAHAHRDSRDGKILLLPGGPLD